MNFRPFYFIREVTLNKQIGYRFKLTIPWLLCMLMLGGCGNAMQQGNSSRQHSLQLLQNTRAVMKKLTTVHFNVSNNFTIKFGSPPTGLSSTILTTTNGVEKDPAQIQLEATVNFSENGRSTPNNSAPVRNIQLAGKHYSNIASTQTWYVVNTDIYAGMKFYILDVTAEMRSLLALASQGQIEDKGYQTINGAKLHHLSVTINKAHLLDLSQAINNAAPGYGPDKTFFEKRLKNPKGSIEFWIDEVSGYPYRTETKMTYQLTIGNGSESLVPPTTTPTTAKDTGNISMENIINLDKFNQPVTIKAPAGATPLVIKDNG